MTRSRGAADRTSRRDFIARCSAAAASGMLAGSEVRAGDPPPVLLPTVALGPYRVTRLVAGANPISGYSYLGQEKDQEMKAYFTPERTMAFLQQCEREGINTHQFSPNSKADDVYRGLRDKGSKLQLIGLYSKRDDVKKTADAFRPIALAHHGGATDKLFRDGRSDRVHDFVKAVHDAGLLAGVSAHNPDCIKRVADEGWEVDFFMTCFYYVTRGKWPGDPAQAPPILEPTVHYPFYRPDPAAMCEVVRQVKQPCLGFKILGAGRRCADQTMVREAFQFAFSHIKPTDGVIVGMYPRDIDQVRLNAGYARELGAKA